MKGYKCNYSTNQVAEKMKVSAKLIRLIFVKFKNNFVYRQLANGAYRFNEVSYYQFLHIVKRNRINEDERIVRFELELIKAKYSITLA